MLGRGSLLMTAGRPACMLHADYARGLVILPVSWNLVHQAHSSAKGGLHHHRRTPPAPSVQALAPSASPSTSRSRGKRSAGDCACRLRVCLLLISLPRAARSARTSLPCACHNRPTQYSASSSVTSVVACYLFFFFSFCLLCLLFGVPY